MEFQKRNFERRQRFPEGEKGKGGPKEILNVQLKERPKEQKITSSNPVCKGNGAHRGRRCQLPNGYSP